jgi:hypothetical protein
MRSAPLRPRLSAGDLAETAIPLLARRVGHVIDHPTGKMLGMMNPCIALDRAPADRRGAARPGRDEA